MNVSLRFAGVAVTLALVAFVPVSAHAQANTCNPTAQGMATTCNGQPCSTLGESALDADHRTIIYCLAVSAAFGDSSCDSVNGGCTWRTNGALNLISTLTATNNPPNFQFVNLPASYNRLFLQCSGLETTAGAVPELRYGEGSPVTWVGGGCSSTPYIQFQINITEFNAVNGYGGADCALYRGDNNAAGFPMSLQTYFNDITTPGVYKLATTTEMDNGVPGSSTGTPGPTYHTAGGYDAADTNPITGIEVVASGGTFTAGSCSLYGMMQ